MKKLKTLALIFGASLLLIACEDDSDDNQASTNAATQAQQTGANITNGPWIITRFIDDDENETNDYQGWGFDFKANGELVASKDNTSYTGSWLTRVDDGQAELVINLQGPEFILELNEDWKIRAQSASEIQLEDDDDPFTDQLTFTKS